MHEVHKDILAEFIETELRDQEDRMHISCRGGGRIGIDQNEIRIYGFSYGLGKADHKEVAEVIRCSYPQFEKLQWVID